MKDNQIKKNNEMNQIDLNTPHFKQKFFSNILSSLIKHLSDALSFKLKTFCTIYLKLVNT